MKIIKKKEKKNKVVSHGEVCFLVISYYPFTSSRNKVLKGKDKWKGDVQRKRPRGEFSEAFSQSSLRLDCWVDVNQLKIMT